MHRILLCSDDVGDWETLYVDSIRCQEGHSFDAPRLASFVLKESPCDFRVITCGDVSDVLAGYAEPEGYFEMPTTLPPDIFDALWAKATMP